MKNFTLKYSLIILTFAFTSCSSLSNKEIESDLIAINIPDDTYKITSSQFKSAEMVLGKMEKQDFYQSIKANGILDVPPENKAEVSCYYGGTVKKIELLPGQKVQKGQILFVLENPDYIQLQQDYLEAKSQLKYLESNYERQQNLVKDNVSSQKDFLKAESDYNSTKVQVESLSKQIALMNIDPNQLTLDQIQTRINIYSPISGYVTAVNISQGTFLNPSETAISITNTDHIHLELSIFEKDITKVSIGQDIKFKIQEDKNTTYQATVHLINKTVDPEKRTIGIHGHISDKKIEQKLNPGMYIEAEILSHPVSKWALTKDALVEIENQYFALILQKSDDSTYYFVKKEVEIGQNNNKQVEIINYKDFNDSTQFLTNGAYSLIQE